MVKKRLPALTNPDLLDQLADLVLARLAERKNGSCLLSRESGVRIPDRSPETNSELSRTTSTVSFNC